MRTRFLITLFALMLLATACGAQTPSASGGGDGGDGGDGGALTFWTVEDNAGPD